MKNSSTASRTCTDTVDRPGGVLSELDGW